MGSSLTAVLMVLLLVAMAVPVYALTCPNCGKEWPEGRKFCGNCGSRLQASPPTTQAAQPVPGEWERYTSPSSLFTLQKPAGWKVKESFDQEAGTWSCLVTDPRRGWQTSVDYGISPTGRDVGALANHILAGMLPTMPSLKLAPTAKVRDTGKKRVIVFDGTYTRGGEGARRFRCMISGGDGSMLSERIEAPEGEFDQAAPVLLQTLANLRVANLLSAAEGEGAAAGPGVQLVPQQLGSGWAKFSAPPGWEAHDLGKAHCIITDPARRLIFMAGGASFITPRYYVQGVRGVICSPLLSPHEALALATTTPGLGSSFRFAFVKPRTDLTAMAQAFAGPLRPAAVEEFGYTFRNREGVPYTGFSCGGVAGDAMNAGWQLWHFSIMAPSDAFDSALPTLAAVMASYEINGKLAGKQIATNMAAYYRGLAQVSKQIALNSEQMRRENLEIMTNNDRARDYQSYQTTRMIMEETDYLLGASDYVRQTQDGLYDSRGQLIVPGREAAESVTRNMREINTKELFEQVFRGH